MLKKVFDSVRWDFVLSVLRSVGFVAFYLIIFHILFCDVGESLSIPQLNHRQQRKRNLSLLNILFVIEVGFFFGRGGGGGGVFGSINKKIKTNNRRFGFQISIELGFLIEENKNLESISV